MKRLYSLLVACLLVLLASAQPGDGGKKKFSPEKFDAELQQFIVKEAALTPEESARFFPVYKEMLHKQRMLLFGRQSRANREKPADEQECRKAIQERDEAEVEMKRILQQYHNKFLEMLPATKVYEVIKAEDKFHRRKLRQWSRNDGQKGRAEKAARKMGK